MTRRTDLSSRGEIEERVAATGERLHEKELDLDELASDVETVRRTLEGLDLGGTAEGNDAVTDAMESADDVAVSEFENGDNELSDIQGASETDEQELDEHSRTTESDAGRIKDGIDSLNRGASAKEISDARDAALEDVEFLAQQIERAREAREKSEQAQVELQGRVARGRR